MPESGGTASYPYPWTEVYEAVVQAVDNLKGWKVKEANAPYGYLVASISLSLLSYGEDVAIQVTESPPGQSWVSVSSASKFAIFDYGKNKRNIDNLFREIQNVLTQRYYAHTVAQSMSESQNVEGRSMYCPSCGAQQGAQARFCTKCGKQMPPLA